MYFFALARRKRRAAWQSWAWAGKRAFWLKRYSTLATAYPRASMPSAGGLALVPALHPPPWIQMTTGSASADFSGRYRSSACLPPGALPYFRSGSNRTPGGRFFGGSVEMGLVWMERLMRLGYQLL